MAAPSLVTTDDSLLSKLDLALLKLERFFALLGGLAIFGLMVLAVVSVGGRNGFGTPLPGYVDWIEQAMPIIAFMGVSFVMREGGHIRMDMVSGRLRGRALYIAELISTIFILIFMALLVWGTWAHFDRSFDFAAPLFSRDSSMDIALPLWPAKLLAPVAFSIICLRLCLQIWGFMRAIVTGQAIGVPTAIDAAQQAQREAGQLGGQP